MRERVIIESKPEKSIRHNKTPDIRLHYLKHCRVHPSIFLFQKKLSIFFITKTPSVVQYYNFIKRVCWSMLWYVCIESSVNFGSRKKPYSPSVWSVSMNICPNIICYIANKRYIQIERARGKGDWEKGIIIKTEPVKLKLPEIFS